MSKKESKMRAIFGSPNKDNNISWTKETRSKIQEDLTAFKIPEDLSAFKQLPKQPAFKDENIDLNALNSYYQQPRLQTVYSAQQPLQCTNMLYNSPPAYNTVSARPTSAY